MSHTNVLDLWLATRLVNTAQAPRSQPASTDQSTAICKNEKNFAVCCIPQLPPCLAARLPLYHHYASLPSKIHKPHSSSPFLNVALQIKFAQTVKPSSNLHACPTKRTISMTVSVTYSHAHGWRTMARSCCKHADLTRHLMQTISWQAMYIYSHLQTPVVHLTCHLGQNAAQSEIAPFRGALEGPRIYIYIFARNKILSADWLRYHRENPCPGDEREVQCLFQ